MKKQDINKICSENYGSLLRPELPSGWGFLGSRIPNPDPGDSGSGFFIPGIFVKFPRFMQNLRDIYPGIRDF